MSPRLAASKRIFLSYAWEEDAYRNLVKRFATRLREDGIDARLDAWHCQGATTIPQFMQHETKVADFVLILCSPLYKAKVEAMDAAEKMTGSGYEGMLFTNLLWAGRPLETFVPVLLKGTWIESVPAFLSGLPNYDLSDMNTFEVDYRRLLQRIQGLDEPAPPLGPVLDGLQVAPVPALRGSAVVETLLTDRTALPPVQTPRCAFKLPYSSLADRFIGRVDELWKLHDQLSRPGGTSIVTGAAAVAGGGGLGKTQLAVEYAHRFHPFYLGGVFWVEAEQGIARLIQVVSQAAEIDVNGKLPEREQLAQVWAALARRAGVSLVVLDNFPEKIALRPWLPLVQGRTAVLATTRRRDLDLATVPVMAFTDEEGVRLLNAGARAVPDDQEARALVRSVGGLALALELLRGYLNRRRDVTVKALRESLGRKGELPLLERFAKDYCDELPTGHERNVAATFQLSWDQASADARAVLLVMAQLAPEPVPLRLLRAVLEWEAGATTVEDRLADAVAQAWELSLVERSAGEIEPSAHRLLLAFAEGMPGGEACRSRVVACVYKEMERVTDDRDTRALNELEGVLPHAMAVAESPAGLDANTLVDLWNYMGWHHGTRGRYALGVQARKALAVAADFLPAGHASIATCQSNLALVLKDLGELAEARDLLQQALEADERSFAPGHPSIAIRQSKLAMVLRALGELDEARDLLRQALEADERSFAPGHPSIAIDQSNLALVLKDLGELDEARDLLRQALKAAERSFGPGHPSIAIRQSNLATVLQARGELDEARDLLRKALAALEQCLPVGHRNIETVRQNLAAVEEALLRR